MYSVTWKKAALVFLSTPDNTAPDKMRRKAKNKFDILITTCKGKRTTQEEIFWSNNF